jgi:hypothetical protein
MKKQSLLLGLLLITGLIMGCNKKEDDSGSKVRTTNRSIPATSPQNPNYWANGNSSNGYSNWTPATGYLNGVSNFQDAIYNFLAPPMDIESIGSVDRNNGFQFQGVISFDTNGRLNKAQSGITVKVTDSFELQGQEAIEVIGIAGSTGTVNRQTGQTTVTFEDEFGRLTLNGVYDWDYFEGEAVYTNKKNGTTLPLGEFNIETCGFFICG